MRILLSTPYDLAVPGGVSRHALELLDALTAHGLDARLVGPASSPVFADDPRITRIGRVWVGAFNGAHSRITLDLRIRRQVADFVRGFRPDIVHLQEPFLPTLNSYLLFNAGRARRVGTFHTYSETSRGYLWSWPWCRWVTGQLDARVAVSPAARDFATRYHPARYEIITHGVRRPPASSIRPAGPAGRPVRLLMVGRVGEPRKGFAVLRDALARLERTAPGKFRLTVIGPDRPDDDGLPITWSGQLSNEAASRMYASIDLVIVPSTSGESFGLVALEALAHGVPIVASRIRGHADWLGGADVGALVPPGDPSPLASAIMELAAAPARYERCAANACALAARYDWDHQVGQWLALYASVCSNEHGRG